MDTPSVRRQGFRVDPFALLVLAGASLGAWWLHRYQRGPRRLRLGGAGRYETDAEVALHVALHESRSRRHEWLSSLHLLYGLLQDERVTEAIGRSGGDASALEDRVLAALDTHEVTAETAREAGWILAYAVAASEDTGRATSCTDLWAALSRSGAQGAALIDAACVSRVAVLFLLFHGEEPEITDGVAGDVHVVLRNDHYTTREFVCDVLERVFELPSAEATTRMQTTHEHGRAVIGRYAVRDARSKIQETRRLARARGFPLWIGVEPV
jgi:ATP-dependent Clp protease adaptor protein ClpS